MEYYFRFVAPVIALLILVIVVYKKRVASGKHSEHSLDEAEVYLAYGKKKQAIGVIEGYLLKHPGDAKAVIMLRDARK